MLPRSGEHAVGANDALDRFFSSGEVSPASMPDTAEEHRRSLAAAAEYRRKRAAVTARGSADGVWTLRFVTPRGEQEAELVLDTVAEVLTGSLNGSPITAARVAGGELTFKAALSSPFPMKITCTATVGGDAMTGKARAAMMSIGFTATREVVGAALT